MDLPALRFLVGFDLIQTLEVPFAETQYPFQILTEGTRYSLLTPALLGGAPRIIYRGGRVDSWSESQWERLSITHHIEVVLMAQQKALLASRRLLRVRKRVIDDFFWCS